MDARKRAYAGKSHERSRRYYASSLREEGSSVLLLVADFDGAWPRGERRGRDRPRSRFLLRAGLGASPYFATLDKAHRRVDDNLVAPA